VTITRSRCRSSLFPQLLFFFLSFFLFPRRGLRSAGTSVLAILKFYSFATHKRATPAPSLYLHTYLSSPLSHVSVHLSLPPALVSSSRHALNLPSSLASCLRVMHFLSVRSLHGGEPAVAGKAGMKELLVSFRAFVAPWWLRARAECTAYTRFCGILWSFVIYGLNLNAEMTGTITIVESGTR